MSTVDKTEVKDAFKKSSENFKKKDLNKVLNSETKILENVNNSSKFSELFEDVKTFFSLLKDYTNGNYTDVPWGTIAAIGGALLYVLSPIDLIPDFIPVVGYLDDIAVVSICLQFVKTDIDKYRNWKNKQ